MTDCNDRARAILRAMGYTPTTLSKATGLSIAKTRRILREGSRLRMKDIWPLCEGCGITANALFGL